MRTRVCLILLLLAGSVLPAGCGFQLRNDRLAERINVPIQVSPASSETAIALGKALALQGIEVTDRANWQVVLDNEKREKRAIALTSRATAAEFRLSHRVWVSLRNHQDETVVQPTLIEAYRSFVVRPAEAAGMEQEERLLILELEQEILERIQRWLSFTLHETDLTELP